GNLSFPLGASDVIRASSVGRMETGHCAREHTAHTHLIEEAATKMRQLWRRDAPPLAQRVATSAGFVFESVVDNGKNAKIDERATEERCDGDFVEQRCFLPGANAEAFILAQTALGIVR